MNFNEKLIFLMKISQTSNKELASGISVDPSLISLLRSGKRKQPQNPNHIKNMAAFFSNRCSAEFQRNALSEMLGQSSIGLTMPKEILADRLETWLTKDSDITDQIITGMEEIPSVQQDLPESEITTQINSNTETLFFYGEKGRRDAMLYMFQHTAIQPQNGSILVVSDDNLEWLLSDYVMTRQIQTRLIKMLENGFTFQHIMPAINFLPRYAEALQFWLPLYNTGHVNVYYYPRLRDNLYRRSSLILPGNCVRISNSIGLNSDTDITMISTDQQIVNAYTEQFQEHLSLCRPAMYVHTELKDFSRLFSEITLMEGNHINMMYSLSPSTIPRELLEQVINETNDPVWKSVFEMSLEHITHFEKMLNNRTYIDIVRLASPEDIRSGKVGIMPSYEGYPTPPSYTPETYILHLKNILRLMEQYENYYFVPLEDKSPNDFSLIVNSDGLALLIRSTLPPIILEMKRPELVIACQEHLIRKAEQAGYRGIHKEKYRQKINILIKELQR